jgi:hypothetical protein
MHTAEDAVLLYILRDERILDPSGGFDKHGCWWADETTDTIRPESDRTE